MLIGLYSFNSLEACKIRCYQSSLRTVMTFVNSLSFIENQFALSTNDRYEFYLIFMLVKIYTFSILWKLVESVVAVSIQEIWNQQQRRRRQQTTREEQDTKNRQATNNTE